MDLTEAGNRAWNIIRPLVRADGSIFAVIEDEVLRQADISSQHVREAVKHHVADTFKLESIEIGLPGGSRPGFILHATARPGMDAVADASNAVRTPDAGKDRFPRIAELISIARWHIPQGNDRAHRTKVVEEAEAELRFARSESNMLSEELAKPQVDSKVELIAKLEKRAKSAFEDASRRALRSLKRGEPIDERTRKLSAQGVLLESIVHELKYELTIETSDAQAN